MVAELRRTERERRIILLFPIYLRKLVIMLFPGRRRFWISIRRHLFKVFAKTHLLTIIFLQIHWRVLSMSNSLILIPENGASILRLLSNLMISFIQNNVIQSIRGALP